MGNNGNSDNNNIDLDAQLRSYFGGRSSGSNIDPRDIKDIARGMRELSRQGRSIGSAIPSQSWFQDQHEMEYGPSSRYQKSKQYRRTGNPLDDFETGIRDGLLDAVSGGDFKKGVGDALDTFVKEFGFELKDLPHELGKEIVGRFISSGTGKKIGEQITHQASNLLGKVFDGKGADGKAAKDAILKMTQNIFGGSSKEVADAAKLTEEASKVTEGTIKATESMGEAAGEAAGETAAAGNAMAGLTSAAVDLIPAVLAILVVAYELGPALEGLVATAAAVGKSFNRQEEIRKKMMENAQKRLQDDIEYMARQPFEILMEAAKKWESTWDANLSKVSLTQGYTKENVYDLYESIANRLISEGYGSTIAATDVISNLSSILDAGLSGKVAEEFAYIATKLSATIPTENFVGYASTYAQLASDEMARGASQAEAIAYANQQLELFASNLLYSSRNLSEGFTTGLKDASGLFKDAVDIAQTAKTGNAAEISGTLTSISAIIGAVAPDLASGLVQNVVGAAIGGNNDSIVALRSLAGVNAGNTAFLQELAKNPQGIFVQMFRTLANMQNMSPENYMEVAEGLSSVFGVDMKAFARVDFNNLADKIEQMTISTAALNENTTLLKEGEATMSTEQLKLQEINNTILNEGLAYIIDSEAGRMIQEHMWQEQIANQLAETEYAVSIQGAALQFLEGIQETIHNLLIFFNPAGYIAQGIDNLIASVEETSAARQDIADILQMTAVGANQKALDNLLTVGQDLGLTSPLIEMMGGKSNYSHNSDWVNTASAIGTGILSIASPLQLAAQIGAYSATGSTIGVNSYYANGGADLGFGLINAGNPGATAGIANSSIQSRYSGFNVGKSAAWSASGSSKSLPAVVKNIISNAAENAIALSNDKFQQFLDSAEEASKTMTYEKYKSHITDYGLKDWDESLANYGISEEKVKGYFEAHQARQGAIQENERKEDEQRFRDENRKFWDYATGSSGVFQTVMWLPFINEEFKPFFDSGARYDQRMDAVDLALVSIQDKEDILADILGDNKEFTVISVLTSINDSMQRTFVNTGSAFQKCLADWIRYIADKKAYSESVSSANAWNELKQAESDRQNETLLALANAMNVFSEDELKKMDPQMQANALLGKIVIILEAMMQQQNNQAGGLSLIDTMSALGLGITQRST